MKKERSAINRLARYLHTLGAIDTTEILTIEGSRCDRRPRAREALSSERWEQVKDAARAPTTADPRRRSSQTAAARDLALMLVLGDMGLRSEEARSARLEGDRPAACRREPPVAARAGQG